MTRAAIAKCSTNTPDARKERALQLARQFLSSGGTCTLAVLRQRSGCDGTVIKRILKEAGLSHVLDKTSGW